MVMPLLAAGVKRFRYHTDSPLITYLLGQQTAICAASTPGAATQRAFVNPNPWDVATGETYGGFNPNLFLKGTAPGFTNFDTDAVLGGAGTCSSKVFISPHHYLLGCGAAHSYTDTADVKLLGADFRIGYQVSEYTGTIVKLLPDNWHYYTNNSVRLPAFARMHNTYIGADSATDAERQWVMPVLAFNGVGTDAYAPTDSLFAWAKTNPADPYKMVSGGDSGSPIFCGLFGAPVILSFIQGASAVGQVHIAGLYWTIVSLMNSLATTYSDPLAGTYRPQVVDLSVFD